MFVVREYDKRNLQSKWPATYQFRIACSLKTMVIGVSLVEGQKRDVERETKMPWSGYSGWRFGVGVATVSPP